MTAATKTGRNTSSATARTGPSGIDRIREQLEEELELAEAEAGRLAAEHAAAVRDVDAIKGAISALGRPGRGAKKPAYKKAEVVKLIASLLKDAGGPMSISDIDAAVRDRVTQSGRPATGIAQRVKEALKDAAFSVQDGNVELA